MKRYALVSIRNDSAEVVARYLPGNYENTAYVPCDPESNDLLVRLGPCVLVEGEDVAGWTLDGYVLPRLASGLIAGHEIDLSHPVMKQIPAQ